jgi:hypothetical protein
MVFFIFVLWIEKGATPLLLNSIGGNFLFFHFIFYVFLIPIRDAK